MCTMTRRVSVLIRATLGCALTFAGSGVHAQELPRVTAFEEISGSQAVYHYRVENRDAEQAIVQLWVGYDYTTDEIGLPAPPAGWTEDTGIPPGNATSPPGWTVSAVREEEQQRFFIRWLSAENDASTDIAPQSVATFSVSAPTPIALYRTTRWVAFFDDGQVAEGRLEPISAKAPPADLLGTLVVNSTPLTLQFRSPEQNARVWFYAEGKRIRLSVRAPAPCTQVLIRSPQGGTITSRIFASDGTLDAVLSDTGKYQLYVDPPNSLLSAPTLWLVDVDGDPHAAIDDASVTAAVRARSIDEWDLCRHRQ